MTASAGASPATREGISEEGAMEEEEKRVGLGLKGVANDAEVSNAHE